MTRHRTNLIVLLTVLASLPGALAGESVEFYRSSFEGTDGGWTADADWDPVGDWERGTPAASSLVNCGFSVDGPGAAFDGKEVWGTRLTECYTNAGGSSFLRQTFDFTTVVGGELIWRQFRHIIGSLGNERAVVYVNGAIVYVNPLENTSTDGYELERVDLTPYGGLASVEIVFELFATTSINAAGWYLDDVIITSLVHPNPGDLGVRLADQPDPVTTVGDPVVYTVTVINHSDVAASNVVVKGTLDPALFFRGDLSDPALVHDGSGSGGTFSINVGSMNPFSFQEFAIGAETTQLGFVKVAASVSGDEADPNPANDAASETTEVTLITDLSARLTSDQNPVITDTPFAYSIEVANLGPSAAVNAGWSLTLPTSVSFLGSSEGSHDGSPTGGVVSGTIGNLAAGTFHVVTVNAVPVDGSAEDLFATAQVAVGDPDASDPEPLNNGNVLTIGQVASADSFATAVFTATGFDFGRKKPLPTSKVPDLPDARFSSFARPHISPNGQNWGFHGFLDTDDRDRNEVIVLVDPKAARTVIHKGVTPMPDVKGETVGLIRDKFTINDFGCYAFYADTNNFDDVILKGCGSNIAGANSLVVIARQGNPVPGDPPDITYSFGSEEPNLVNDGTVRFYANTQGAIGSNNNKFVVETPDDGVTVNKLLQEGISVPAGQAGGATDPWDDWRREFSNSRNGMYVTGDGLHTLLSGFTTGDSTMNDIVTFDDTVVIQEGVIVDPIFTSPVQDPDGGLYLAPNGDWYARGTNADGSQWVVRNGEVIARTGDEIFPGAGEHWTNPGGFPSGFFVIAADGNGNFVIGGTTDAVPPDAGDFDPPPQAIVLNGERLIMHTRDPVDVDGNGLFDDEAFIGFFDSDGAVLLEDGTLIVSASASVPVPVAGAGGVATTGSEAPLIAGIKVLNLAGACCDLLTGACMDDVLQFDCPEVMAQHFEGKRCAEIPCGSGACCVVEFGNNTAGGDPTGVHCEDDVPASQCASEPLNEFKGDGTLCANVTCGGACCVPGDPPCFDAFTEPECAVFSFGGGIYQGDGTRCAGVLCDPCDSDEDCDDGDACNGRETCVIPSGNAAGTPAGYCVPGVPPETDDGIDCTVDECDPLTGEITHTPHDAACSDGDPCNGAEQCDGQQGCVPGTSPTCDDGIACTNDTCDTSHPDADPQTGCVHRKNDDKCDDGIACTVNRCLALDTGSGCVFNPDTTFCQDEDLCTTNERCDVVQGCIVDPVNCDDGKSCTTDTCDPNFGCLNGADDSKCDDGVDCTRNECVGDQPGADADGCVFRADDALCPSTDLCVSRRCDPLNDCQDDPRECPDDGDPCTREFCDSSTGECEQESICGACCRQGQPCIDALTPAQCSGPDDTFMGLGTTCATALCGACCDPATGACTDGVTDDACAAAVRIFQGPGTNCIQDPCTGACCDPGFTGLDIPVPGCHFDKTAEECAAIDDDAIFMGVGTDCFTAPCGACCDPATSDRPQSCLDAATAEFCEALEFVYAGDQTSCINDPCRGACCLADGRCIVAAAEDCGGDFRGNGTDCVEVEPPCEPFIGGACCLEGGLCFDDTTRETCVNSLFGVYLGDGVTCENPACNEDTVRADFDGDGSVDMRDVDILFRFFGKQVTPGTSGDINGDGVVDEMDWDRFFQVHNGPT